MEKRIVEGFQLSPQQARVWQSQADCSAFRARCALLLQGDVDAERLQRAVHELVRRHSILRTTFSTLSGLKMPLQVVGDSVSQAFDWSMVSNNGSRLRTLAAEVAELFIRDETAPFDFERGPLMRVTLNRLSPGESLLLISLPSLCADARTLVILSTELGSLYKRGCPHGEQEEPLEYSQFATWQNDLLADEDAERGRTYWRELIATASTPLRLACEPASLNGNGFDPKTCELVLTPEETARLHAVAAERGGSTEALLFAAWKILLWRLTGHNEIVVGNVCDGRGHKRLRDACGLFTRTLPIRARLEPSLRFDELLRHLKASITEAAAWQDSFNGEDFSDDTNVNPLFPFPFAYEDSPAHIDFGNISCTVQRHETWSERFKINCTAINRADKLHLELRYDAGRLHACDVEYLLRLYATLLRSTLAKPESRIDELNLLDATARTQLQIEFNDTVADFAHNECAHQQFEAQVERHPDAVAVVFRDQQLTYQELNNSANRLARHLRGLGIGAEDVVGLFMDRSTDMIVALLAILKAGGAYLPLDPAQPIERLTYMLSDSGVRVVLTTSRLLSFLPEHCATTVLLDNDRDTISNHCAANLTNLVTPENLAYVIYTSGSTGPPKCVMVQHRSLINLVAALDTAIYRPEQSARRVSLNAPLTFDASVKQWSRLLRGHTLVLLPEEVRLDASEVWRYLAQHGVEVLDCTPTHLKALLAAEREEQNRDSRPLILIGGEAIDTPTWTKLTKTNVNRLYNLYGLTECTVDSAIAPVSTDSPCTTIGRPLSNTQIHLLDDKQELLPIGAAGEIYIGGEGLARGYLRAPSLTAERFIPDPFSTHPGARLYKTGDAGRRLPNGEIEFIGRLDYQLKIRGFRVEPAEVEAALMQYPAVKEAVVTTSRKAEEFSEARLIAYVVLHNDQLRSTKDVAPALREFLHQRLPEFMVPADFVWLERLPLTANGKVDRQALPDWAARNTRTQAPYVAPRNEIERKIAAVWESLLNVEHIGIDDNFFDLGGHSLLLTYAYNQLRDSLDQKFSIIDLFRFPTVSSLAQHLSAQGQPTISQQQIHARVEKQKEWTRRRRQAVGMERQ